MKLFSKIMVTIVAIPVLLYVLVGFMLSSGYWGIVAILVVAGIASVLFLFKGLGYVLMGAGGVLALIRLGKIGISKLPSFSGVPVFQFGRGLLVIVVSALVGILVYFWVNRP